MIRPALLAVAILGCGSYRAPTVRAMAVAVGAFGTAGVQALQVCADESWATCREQTTGGLLLAAFLSLGAFSTTFLASVDEVEDKHERAAARREGAALAIPDPPSSAAAPASEPGD